MTCARSATVRFCLVSLLAGCATASSTSQGSARKDKQASDFFALSMGTSWEYEAAMLGERRTLPVRIVKVADGVAEDSTGARLLADAFGVRDDRRYLLRNPIETGTRWNNVVSPSSVESYEIVAIEQPCDAPAGHWEGCVVVESRNRIDQTRMLVNEITLAPSVGIVRIATTLEEGGRRLPQSTLILRKFASATGQVDAGSTAR